VARRVDPQTFMLLGCVTDWAALGAAQQQPGHPLELARERGLDSPRMLQLRWFFDPALGYPRTPFTVWARRRKEAQVEPAEITATPLRLGTTTALQLDGAYPEVFVALGDGPGGFAYACHGMPNASPIVDVKPVAAGATTVRLSAPEIRVVVVPAGSSVDAVLAQPNSAADDKHWEAIEIVGLPGDGTHAAGTDLLAPQGLVNALTDPVSAALDRFRRGAPLYGWDTELEAGAAAPGWLLADPVAIVKVFQAEMLPDFVDMVDGALATDQQRRDYFRKLLTPTGRAAELRFNPLRVLLIGATTDPLNSLITGFGTAYDASVLGRAPFDGPATHALPRPVGAEVDFMVTATFVDVRGRDVEWAALLLGGVSTSLPPATPAGVTAVSEGLQSPALLDGAFQPVVTVSWDAAPTTLPFHLGSQALARRGLSPPAGAVALMEPRPYDKALQPVGASVNANNPARRAVSDSSYAIDGAVATNTLRYSVATQDIFGRWSKWGGASCDAGEPPPGRATLLGPRLDTRVATGPCPATLTVDVAWDWSNRSPQRIDILGRAFGQVWPSDPPADASVPANPGSFRFGLSGLLLSIEFDVDGRITGFPPAPGLSAGVRHLSADSTEFEVLPLTLRGPRRYRVEIGGFDLDFDAAARWGLALWARGTEHVSPEREGPFTSPPVVTSASDPRPPAIVSTYEAVTLASLRDAQGLHHARLEWAPMPGSVEYRIYTCAESTFRSLTGMPQVTAAQTLTQRLAELRAAFAAKPARRPFTRTSALAVTGTATQVALPRGTKDLHLFVVLGVSAGGVESAWPVATDPQCGKRFVAFAAPQTVAPGPPALEVGLAGDGRTTDFAARVRVKTAPGARVSKVDLHRVRVPEAAVSADTMGPPVATISGTGGAFTVTATPPGDASSRSGDGVAQALGTITGEDAVAGSWKPVFYRAVAWGADDADRGQYGVRSQPSVVRQVVVPPSAPPDLSAPAFVLPVAGSAAVRVTCSTVAPVTPTTLGPHTLEAEVVATDAAGASSTVVAVKAALDELPTEEPAAGLSGCWRAPTAGDVTPLHLLVRRADPATALRVRVRLSDPLGRLTERTLDVPAAPEVPVPDLSNLTLTTVAGGTLLAFTTAVPNAVPGVGAYRLEVRFRPPRGRGVARAEDLADIPQARRREDIFSDLPEEIPFRRTKRALGTTSIAVGIRREGTVTLAVVAPDGTRATESRRIDPDV
jgi:hypothetical protein